MAINPTIGDLSGAFAPQQAMAQSGLGQVLAGVKDDKLAALMMRGQTQRPMAPPNAPKLNFDTNATGIGTGIVQGLGNAVNNSLQMRQFGQQQQAQQQYMQQQRDLMQQLDLAMAEKQKAADLAAANEAAFIQTLPAELQPLYKQSDDIGRRAILHDMSQPMTKPAIVTAETQAKAAAEQKAAQEKLNWQRERFHALTGLFPEQAFSNANQGPLSPQVQSAWKYVYDSDPPVDALDAQNRQNQASKLNVEAQAAPTLTAQQIEQNALTMQTSKLNNVLKTLQVEFEGPRLRELVNGQQLDNKAKADKLQRIDTAEKIFNAFQDRLSRGEVTPQDIAQVQSQIGMLNNIDPSLDISLKRIMGLKQDDTLDSKKLKTFFQTQAPKPPASSAPQRVYSAPPSKAVRDLGTANKKLVSAASKAGAKKQQALGNIKKVESDIKQKQSIQKGYKNVEQGYQKEMDRVNALLKKYSKL